MVVKNGLVSSRIQAFNALNSAKRPPQPVAKTSVVTPVGQPSDDHDDHRTKSTPQKAVNFDEFQKLASKRLSNASSSRITERRATGYNFKYQPTLSLSSSSSDERSNPFVRRDSSADQNARQDSDSRVSLPSNLASRRGSASNPVTKTSVRESTDSPAREIPLPKRVDTTTSGFGRRQTQAFAQPSARRTGRAWEHSSEIRVRRDSRPLVRRECGHAEPIAEVTVPGRVDGRPEVLESAIGSAPVLVTPVDRRADGRSGLRQRAHSLDVVSGVCAECDSPSPRARPENFQTHAVDIEDFARAKPDDNVPLPLSQASLGDYWRERRRSSQIPESLWSNRSAASSDLRTAATPSETLPGTEFADSEIPGAPSQLEDSPSPRSEPQRELTPNVPPSDVAQAVRFESPQGQALLKVQQGPVAQRRPTPMYPDEYGPSSQKNPRPPTLSASPQVRYDDAKSHLVCHSCASVSSSKMPNALQGPQQHPVTSQTRSPPRSPTYFLSRHHREEPVQGPFDDARTTPSTDPDFDSYHGVHTKVLRRVYPSIRLNNNCVPPGPRTMSTPSSSADDYWKCEPIAANNLRHPKPKRATVRKSSEQELFSDKSGYSKHWWSPSFEAAGNSRYANSPPLQTRSLDILQLIDLIITEHTNTLKGIINNLQCAIPSLHEIQRLSTELVEVSRYEADAEADAYDANQEMGATVHNEPTHSGYPKSNVYSANFEEER